MDKIKRVIKLLGPGLVTGASDDDPSGIATYSQTGAQFGYNQLWVTFFSTPFMIVIQEMCARAGFVTGRGLAGILKKYYPRPFLYGAISILLIANIINIGADLGAMASSFQLLVHLPSVLLVILSAVVSLCLQIFIPYKTYVKYLKYLAFALLSYFLTVIIVKQDWGKILHATFIPSISLNKDYILNVVALLGTTISPYLFFWQSNEEVEERIDAGRQQAIGRKVGHTLKKDIWHIDIDTSIGMLFSNLIAFFVILTCASTLGTHGIKTIDTANQAAEALRPIAGNFAFLLFALGIIGGGLLAVPVLAGSNAYALAESRNWIAGLYKKPKEAPKFYAVIALSTIVGILINFSPIPPFKLLYYTAALNGIAAPPLMALIILITNNKQIMKNHKNHRLSTILGWIITAIMGLGAIALILSLFQH